VSEKKDGFQVRGEFSTSDGDGVSRSQLLRRLRHSVECKLIASIVI
jgi:hypothetical protein